MSLSNRLYTELTEAISDAFRTPAKLNRMLRFRLGRRLNEITLADNLIDMVFGLIDAAEAEGWVDQLIIAALDENPGNPKLRAVAQQLGLKRSISVTIEEEAIIRSTNKFLDINLWNTRLSEYEMCVCRVETPSAQGTGFLIGPDIVITNHHVVRKVIDGSNAPEDVIFRFDHKKLANGKTLDGTIYYMAKNGWLIDSSPPSPVDNTPDPKGVLPREDELDYALLRAASAPGNEVLSGEGKSNTRLRSWIKIPTSPYHFEPSTLLVILQYPLGDILKFALDTDSIIGLNANHTRLQYRTNTQRGSSGAPCFNSMLELVALHRGGSSTHNVGIPFFAIRSLLEKRGFKDILNQATP